VTNASKDNGDEHRITEHFYGEAKIDSPLLCEQRASERAENIGISASLLHSHIGIRRDHIQKSQAR
jgi:hypothetical protein